MSNSILDLPFILETRRNHALEHATLHVLAEKHPTQPMAGHSNPTGFFILGELPTDDIQSAAAQALARLRAGESELAIHPGCGTNLATTALLAGTLAWLVMRGAHSTFGRKPYLMRHVSRPFMTQAGHGMQVRREATPEQWDFCMSDDDI